MTLSGFKEKACGKTAEVLGLGVSNLPLIDFLLDCGMHVKARDKKTREQLGAKAAELEQKGVKLILGEDYMENIEGDYVFRSPGIRPDLTQIAKAVSSGAVLTSEMELFFELCPARTIGVTGSDGKTTTTTLISLLLRAQGFNVFCGGNIGTPLLPVVSQMRENDFAVLELSSFQLMTMKRSCGIAVLTNLSPNHLDWHRGMEEYIEAKTNIFTHPENRIVVLNADNPPSMALKTPEGSEKRFFSSEKTFEKGMFEKDGNVFLDGELILRKEDVLLPGRHNKQNYMAAYSAVKDYVPVDVLKKIAGSFGGVEHRLEFVREYRGVKIYNSSIDSSPSRTAAALSCFDKKVVVICGGYDKHIPFSPLADALCAHAKTVVLTGATAGAIKEALDECKAEEKPRILYEHDFEKAVRLAVDSSLPGDALLLSPGCASFDAFPNFMVRGQTFKKIINGLE